MDSNQTATPERAALEHVVVRFAGDSGDGMQVAGGRFALETALVGNDLATFPDFPAEIRAPAGTPYGISTFQIHFGSRPINTAGDELDVLVAFNPAALKTNLDDVREGGLVIVDSGRFTTRDLAKAGYTVNPLDGEALAGRRVLPIDITQRIKELLEHMDAHHLSHKAALRSRNMWALGLLLWLYARGTDTTESWVENRFADDEDVRNVNLAALRAGFSFGETAELGPIDHPYHVPPAKLDPGTYRHVTGTEALCLGIATAASLAGRSVLYGSYPITPASTMLHILTRLGEFGIQTFQAEDEIAAVCAAVGAAYAGRLGVTASSGPGIALKSEAIGLAAAVELPLLVINAQRGGPSTGLPTKTEQSDLYQAVFGRNADTPVVVLAPRSPGDCFFSAIEAIRLAVRYMTPVILLTDGYLANAAEPWRLPDLKSLPAIETSAPSDAAPGAPYARDPHTLTRPWIVPGTPGGEHRIGGLERKDVTGAVSYDPANHQRMTDLRCTKIRRIAEDLPLQAVDFGPDEGPLAVLGWGSTFGAIHSAVTWLHRHGRTVSHVHLRHLWPLPSNLADLLGRFERVLIPEMNTGQLSTLVGAECGIEPESFCKVQGRPFMAREIESRIEEMLQRT